MLLFLMPSLAEAQKPQKFGQKILEKMKHAQKSNQGDQAFCRSQSKPASAEIISTELMQVNGTIQGQAWLWATDTLTLFTPVTFKLPQGWVGTATIPRNYLYAGDSLLFSFTLSYAATDLPFYPQKIALEIPVKTDSTTAQAVGRVYFTPYNTVELWNEYDFGTLNRTWLMPNDNVVPVRVYIPRNEVPVSDLNLATDTLGGVYQENVIKRQVYVKGLAYTVPLRDIVNLNGEEQDGLDTLVQAKRFFPRTFLGTITGRLVSPIENDVRIPTLIPLSGILIRLKERDRFWWDETFAEVLTDANGFFSISYNVEQSAAEGNDVELYLEIRSQNTLYEIRATRRYNPLSAVSQQIFDIGNTGQDLNLGLGNIITTIGQMRSVNWATRSWDYVENQGGYTLHRGLLIMPNPRPRSSYFISIGLVHISISTPNGDFDHENTFYHEFGHFLMWNLQNKGDTFVYGNPTTQSTRHTWDEESSLSLAWSEGWANAIQMIMDAAHWWEDNEYGHDEISFRNGGNALYEFKRNFSLAGSSSLPINQGFFSEYYIACALYDIWDGADKGFPDTYPVNGATPTITVGHNDLPIWNDNFSVSIRDVLTPLWRNIPNNAMEYFYRFRDNVIPASDWESKEKLARTFVSNWVVPNGALNANNSRSLSGDVISIISTEGHFGWNQLTNNIETLSYTTKLNPAFPFFATQDIVILPSQQIPTNQIPVIFENFDMSSNSANPARLWLRSELGSQTYITRNNPRLLFEACIFEIGNIAGLASVLDMQGNALVQVGNQGVLRINDNSRLIVRSGATLRLRAGSSVQLGVNAEIVVEQGGYICMEDNVSITMQFNAGFILHNGALLGLNPFLGLVSIANCIAPPINNKKDALNFDGVNDVVNINDLNNTLSFDVNGNFTIEALVKLSNNNSSQAIVSTRNGTSGYAFGISENGRPFIQFANNSPIIADANINVIDGNCHHVAVTVNNALRINYAKDIYFYVDGILLNSIPYNTPILNLNANNPKVGVDSPNPTAKLKGFLGELRFWNYRRTHTQIQQTYNQTFVSPQTGLVAVYDFVEQNGQEVYATFDVMEMLKGSLGTLNNAIDVADPTRISLVEVGCNVTGNFGFNAEYEPENNTTDIVISPNPFSTKLKLTLPNEFEHNTEVTMLNLKGQVVRTFQVNVGENILSDLETISAGIYFLKITGNQKTTTFKVVKQ